MLETLAPRKAINHNRLFTALLQNLTPTFGKFVAPQFLKGKMETFLTCLAVSTYLKNNLFDEKVGKMFEELSLSAIHKTFATPLDFADVRLLLSEMPKILKMPYPVVNDIRLACINIIPQFMNIFRMNNIWREFTDLEYIQSLLKDFDA